MSASAVAVAPSSASASARRRPARRRFYVGISIFMTAIMVVGFWPSYFARLLRGDVARPLVVQLHGIVFVGWMVLLLTQVLLAASGRVRTHRRVGSFGIAYGWLVLAMGLLVGVAAPILHLKAGDWNEDRAAAFLLTTLGDMVLWGVFFGAAVFYRPRPEIHKRLMLVATVGLLFAAVGRMRFVSSIPVMLLVWLSPLIVAMVYDWKTRGRVHPAYIIGTAGLFVGAMRELVAETNVWLPLGHRLLALFV
jgi:hypothetical protein